MSVTDVGDHLRQARQNRQAQRRLLDQLDGQVRQRKSEVDSSLADLPTSQRGTLVNRAVSGFRGELKRSSSESRTRHVREAARLWGEAREAKDHYRSSVQFLMRASLGSERRSRLLHQIETSGAAELASLAELAAATRDLELGAALCSKVSSLPPSERPFSQQDLADALVGDEHRGVNLALMELERLAEEAAADETAFERGSPDPIRILTIAHMAKAAAEFAEGMTQPQDIEGEDQ